MQRFLFLVSAAIAAMSAHGQNYTGTFTTTNPQGGTVTLTLRADGAQQVKGTLSGNNTTFQVVGEVTPEGVMGAVTGEQGNLYLMARYEGASLVVILAEPDATGQPNLQSARRIVFARASGDAPKPAAASGADRQIREFLTANAWCSFSFNQRSGASSRSRIVFHGNGTVVQSSNRETYSSGPAGSVAGQYGGGDQGYWKVTNGMLHMSRDNVSWQPMPLEVTRNSNGSPIVKSGGVEYMVCR
jgi:hypothetical protein